MAEACGMSGEQDTCTTGFGGKTWKKETTWKTQEYVGE
jgi:hypothetical protein